ncbi:Fructosamine/Ketosamine-3-kinase [Xylogone sp. PMI_703]|nr:Fructosamine/Ketosamine-3-kinase [Xylogone sp. PMI_703]
MAPYLGYDEELQVDPNVLEKLPNKDVIGMIYHGASAWARTFRIEARDSDGQIESYFLKVSLGHHGREALKGEFESTSLIHNAVPEFAPLPIAWGSMKNETDTHFYLCYFHNLSEELTDPKMFGPTLAKLHQNATSPDGRFGFHVVTYNGNLPQDNDFTDTWEEFFAKGLKHMLNLNKTVAGPSELDDLAPAMFEKVIPRLLRPMEINGRSITPSLVHGDLWYGNAAVDTDTNKPIVFDPCCFWAHNEYELGNWRPDRNKFSQAYFTAYHSVIPRTYPGKDYDDRNALYSIRFNLHAATMFPDVETYRESVIAEMKRLIDKFPNGFDDFTE